MAAKKKNANISWVLNFTIRMFLKCSEIFLCFVLIDIHHEGVGKYVVASVRDLKGLTGTFYGCGKENKSFIHILKTVH